MKAIKGQLPSCQLISTLRGAYVFCYPVMNLLLLLLTQTDRVMMISLGLLSSLCHGLVSVRLLQSMAWACAVEARWCWARV